jgi:hypothetical protein
MLIYTIAIKFLAPADERNSSLGLPVKRHRKLLYKVDDAFARRVR